MAEVTEFRPRLVGDGAKVDVADVLTTAQDQLREVVVVGIQHNGDLYVASSEGAPDCHFLLHQAAHFLIENSVGRS